MPKVFKNKYQRIYHSAESVQGQMLENSPHNTEGVQEQTPENSSKYQNAKSAQGQMLENLLHNAEDFKNKHQRIHNAEDAQEQIPGLTPKASKNKHQKIHHTTPKLPRRIHYIMLKVFKDKHPT
ncbi:10525_t:CDS:2 [Dentiscutata heterogama]|uniref:10525_t:CDS:1 n=1 Tax=Dentiscutata heterogama TaxID=1316150 RepID=A0ACA9LFK5_9GLOM|nr:10525_t:CDS:2 [Dentiscutata heterogama]